jgi:hypothetical protein
VNFSDRQYVKRATRLIDLDQEALKVPANQAAAQMDSDLKACFQHFLHRTFMVVGCGHYTEAVKRLKKKNISSQRLGTDRMCRTKISVLRNWTLAIFFSLSCARLKELIAWGLAMSNQITQARNRCCFAREITRKCLTTVA